MELPADHETIYHCPFCLSTKLVISPRLPHCKCLECERGFDIDDTVITEPED